MVLATLGFCAVFADVCRRRDTISTETKSIYKTVTLKHTIFASVKHYLCTCCSGLLGCLLCLLDLLGSSEEKPGEAGENYSQYIIDFNT